MKKNGGLSMIFMLARGVLHDRVLRRKMMGQLLLMLVILVALGAWGIDKWLEKSVLWFSIYWGLVMLYALLIILLCFYDMLAISSDNKK